MFEVIYPKKLYSIKDVLKSRNKFRRKCKLKEEEKRFRLIFEQ